MRSPAKLLGVAIILAFFGYLLWSTLAAQKDECQVCVEFAGQRSCATASAASADEAARSAQSTACGVLTTGMDQSIACANQAPVERRCARR